VWTNLAHQGGVTPLREVYEDRFIKPSPTRALVAPTKGGNTQDPGEARPRGREGVIVALPDNFDFKLDIDVKRGLAVIEYTEYFDKSKLAGFGGNMCKVAFSYTIVNLEKFVGDEWRRRSYVSYDADKCAIEAVFELPFDAVPQVVLAIASEMSVRALVQGGLSLVNAVSKLQEILTKTSGALDNVRQFFGQSVEVSAVPKVDASTAMKLLSKPPLVQKMMEFMNILNSIPDKLERKPLNEAINEFKEKINKLVELSKELTSELTKQ